jgi:hypothetical protein
VTDADKESRGNCDAAKLHGMTLLHRHVILPMFSFFGAGKR